MRIQFSPVNKKIEIPVNYNKEGEEKFLIKGWLGVYRVKSHPELIKLAWDAGIGSKNPQGFGMFEILDEKQKESTDIS